MFHSILESMDLEILQIAIVSPISKTLCCTQEFFSQFFNILNIA